MSLTLFDAIIVGAGPAGLSAATALARQLHRAVVFDSGVYRNARAQHMHNVLGWDHTPPADFRAAGREAILSRYDTVQFEDVEIKQIERSPTGNFNAFDASDRQWSAKKVVLATGVTDISPDIEGYADCWARGIFHCLFCHGFEERGQESAGILAIGDIAVPAPAAHVARMAKRFASQVTIYTHGDEEVFQAITELLASSTFKIDNRRIVKLVKRPEGSKVEMIFEDGSSKVEGFLTHKPKSKANGPFAEQLGLELTPTGDIKTEKPFFATSVENVFAAGDCTDPLKSVVMAMSSGGLAGVGTASAVQVDIEAEEKK